MTYRPSRKLALFAEQVWILLNMSCGAGMNWRIDLHSVDAHRGDGRRIIVHSEETLTAYLELERVTRES